MSEGLLRQYPRSLREDQASVEAAVEISGYGALQALLKSTGEHLSPRVRRHLPVRPTLRFSDASRRDGLWLMGRM
jgi:hypothetical protein